MTMACMIMSKLPSLSWDDSAKSDLDLWEDALDSLVYVKSTPCTESLGLCHVDTQFLFFSTARIASSCESLCSRKGTTDGDNIKAVARPILGSSLCRISIQCHNMNIYCSARSRWDIVHFFLN